MQAKTSLMDGAARLDGGLYSLTTKINPAIHYGQTGWPIRAGQRNKQWSGSDEKLATRLNDRTTANSGTQYVARSHWLANLHSWQGEITNYGDAQKRSIISQ